MNKQKHPNLIGQHFGKWVVTGPPISRIGIIYYPCKCSCGTEREVTKRRLLSGQSKSCKCSNFEVLVGKKFGNLTVAHYERVKNKVYYSCTCTCGAILTIRRDHLLSGHLPQCICQRRKVFERLAKRGIFRRYQQSAKRRGYDFNLTEKQVSRIIVQPCRYCDAAGGNTFKSKAGSKDNFEFHYNGVDRVDNTQGYNMNNVVTCCKVCNRAKDIMTREEFLVWIAKVYNNQ